MGVAHQNQVNVYKRQRREASLLHVLVYQVSPNTFPLELEEYVTPRPVRIYGRTTVCPQLYAAGDGHPSPFVQRNIS